MAFIVVYTNPFGICREEERDSFREIYNAVIFDSDWLIVYNKVAAAMLIKIYGLNINIIIETVNVLLQI